MRDPYVSRDKMVPCKGGCGDHVQPIRGICCACEAVADERRNLTAPRIQTRIRSDRERLIQRTED